MTKQPKRSHRPRYGEGSFTYLPARGLWRGRLDIGYTPDGKRHRIEVTARSEDEAWAKLRAKLAEKQAGELTPAKRRTKTVASYATDWLEARRQEVRPKTFATDRSTITKWVIPALGRYQLRDLTGDAVRLIRVRMDKGDKTGRVPSSTTIRYAQRIFQQMMTDAKRDGYDVDETVLLAKKARTAVSDRSAIPTGDALAILETASTMPDGSRWVAALLQGMRQAECLGLTWDRVDLDRGEVEVSWQLQALPYADRAAGTFRVPDGYEATQLYRSFHLVRPKSKAGYRVIPLVPWMVSALTQWKDVCPPSPYGLVWPRPDGLPQSSKMDGDAWKTLQALADVTKPGGGHYVLHEARHTTATLLLEAGVDPEVIKSILGHSDIVTSRGYMHTSRALTRQALEKVAARLQLDG